MQWMLFSISFYNYNQMLKLLLSKLLKRLKLFDSYQNDKNKYFISYQNNIFRRVAALGTRTTSRWHYSSSKSLKWHKKFCFSIFSSSVITTSTVWGKICFVTEESTAPGHTVFLQVWQFFLNTRIKIKVFFLSLALKKVVIVVAIFKIIVMYKKYVEYFCQGQRLTTTRKFPSARKPLFFPEESELLPP